MSLEPEITFDSWESKPEIAGQVFVLDQKRRKLAQVFYFIIQKSAEVRGLQKEFSVYEDTMKKLHGILIDKLKSHGVTYAWSTCPHHLALHHEQAYGWRIVGAPDRLGDCQIEFWIEQQEA